MDKSHIRRAMRRQRRQLDSRTLLNAEQGLTRAVSRLPIFRRARHIGIYWPRGGEISPLGLLSHPCSLRKHFYVPVLSGAHHRRLRFAPLRGAPPWRDNVLGIPEPNSPPRYWRSARQLDVLILPLVAFDRTGHRLGMGGGYYDRSLASLRHRQRWWRPQLVGVAHAFQEWPELPADPWDVPLRLVCTERSCWRCGS